MKKKLLKSALLFAMVFGLFLMAPMSIQAADGTTGAIDFDQTSVTEDTLVYVHFIDLTGGADYNINSSDDATGYSFTTGTNQDDIYVPITFSKPSGTNAFVIWLNNGSGGGIDELTVFVTEADTVLNTTAFLAIVVPLLVFAIIVAIYKSIGKK